jgi:hypothetical protein
MAINYFNQTSIFATMAITHALIRAVTSKGLGKSSFTVEKNLVGYTMSVFGLPFAFSLM